MRLASMAPAVFLALFSAACASGPRMPPPFHATVGASEGGLASYYADSLAGRPTASGAPYDPHALSAAHRSIPLGSLIRVQRDDGRSVEVEVNDRGPFGFEDRIVDLSRAAAERLGIVRAGLGRVRLEVLWVAPPRRGRRHP